ncbi:hypothetical protein BTVI_29285 [Pitangus sulphuratus]|nr:hypothetical protein BTVI_29285 [Pitangus sulphuratus]
MLQTVCVSPELLVNQNMGEHEICGYSPGQGSPLPGETASPKSCFQQSPSLPDSGLTELNVVSPELCPPPSCKPLEIAAAADSELSSDPPQKRYMGVRVKMPVRELLRKIRLSKGLDPAHSKSKQSVGQTLKGLEDLDILVEVLQEDLNKSQLKEESLWPVPAGLGQGFSRDLQSSRWEPAGSEERQHSSTRLHPGCCLKDFNPTLRGGAENPFRGDQKSGQQPNSPGMSPRTREESSWWIQGAHAGSREDFPRNSSQNASARFNPSEMLLGAHTGSADAEGHLKLAPGSFTQQDLSAISFFQFQLHREESLLRNIPADKLLAPDENGNRLLHKAVAQGRRALTYALAQRFASLNKIDEKDAEKRTALHLAAEKNQHLMVSDLISLGASVNEQDSCGKTPLHLCAQNGYLRVLEVLKHCKNSGVCVEVDLPDHYGLTPLHCAALAHTALVTECQKTATDTDMGRFLKLRKDQILEGIQCLLQMGGKAELQTYSLLDAPRGIPSSPPPEHFPELCSMAPLDLFDVILKEAEQPEEGQETCVCLGKGRVFQVCAAPRDYQGYDKVLGLCICHTDSLEGVCNSQCRRQQRDTLQFTCAGKRAQLLLTHSNGSKAAVFLEDLRTVLLRPYFSLKDVCASEQGKSTHPTYIVEMSGRGFLGVYNPDPQLFHNFIMSNEASSHHKNNPPSAAAPDKSGHEELGIPWVQSLSPPSSTARAVFTGILNPITCISVNVTILFVVSREHHPVYDVDNLYNTNAEFDWGDFRSLGEEVREASQEFLLFLFQFQEPGTFVLRLSSNRHKRMYVRVMPLGGQCYEEGPFLPTTPRFAVQVGIARKRELLLKPDWAAIAGVSTGLLLLLVASVALTLLCQGLGWSQKGSTCPAFRRRQLRYNLDSCSSDIPRVLSIRKRHPWVQLQGGVAGASCSADGTACSLRRGDGWEPEEQIDLDSFNTNVFFELLLRQSLSVTTTLGHFKEEVKILYEKLTSEMSALKNLWIRTLSVPGKVEAESTGTEGYGKAKQQAEEEMQRRKELAAGYEQSVSRQMQLLQQELEWQEQNCVLFHSALREGVRLAEMLTKDVAHQGGNQAPQGCTRLLAQLEAAISRMSSVILQESHHLKAWGVLGEGSGAPLLNQDQSRTLTKQELVGSNGTAGAPDVVYVDPITGLLTPFPHCSLLLSSHCPGPVPSHHFLHPQTGKVLPLAGNVGYDPTGSRLVCAADSGSGGRHRPEVPIFPYVPYPVCPSTDLPVQTKLPALCPERTFSMGGLVSDPATGMEVPVLGVTIHPHTGHRLALGGTYLNPLTGTLAPLELWGPMKEPEGGKIVPILGVGLDGSTGEVLPLGGLVGPSGQLMLLGDSFTEPLSGKLCRAQGLHLQQGRVVPHSGGYQAVLEADWLLAQTRVLNALKHFQASLLEGSCLAADGLAALKAAAEEMKESLATKCYHALHCLRSLGEKQQIAASVRSNGGKLGVIRYPGTEMWIPAVFGMQIPDPGGSALMVPILGIDHDWNTGQPSPLAGTMEDANGKGLVPITIGAKTISPITGEIGPVIGAQRNPWTHNVIPTVQSLGALPRRATDPDLIQLKEKLEDIEGTCHFLNVSSLQEAERRASRCSSSQVATELSGLFKADRDETEGEMQVLLEIRKALEKLLELREKMQLEEEWIFLQLREGERHRSHIPGAEAATKLRVRKLMLALASESQEWILEQQASVETAHTKLEYLRDLSIIRAQQAKVLFSGSQQCFENYQTARFYGISGVSHGTPEEIQQKLIPLLKSVVQVLGEKSKITASPETPGYSSRSTLKASAAPTEVLRAEASQESTSASIISPVLPTSPSERISQVQQEVQTRLLWEKHACELAHLELSLLMEETSTLCSFCESKAGGKEEHEGSWKQRSRQVQHSPDSVTQMLQVSAVKIVKLEALRQVCLYRVLDLYCNLQMLSCPKGVTRILGSFEHKSNGEGAAQEVAQTREEQQVARAVAFLQEHHREGDLLKGLNTESEAELRKMQAQFRLELQTQTEEKIKAKETQIIQETQGGKFGNLVAYSILSQKHLRETVTLLQDSSRLKKVALRCQKEGTGLGHLVGEFVDEANLITSEVKKFREQKMRRLEEELKASPKNRGTKKSISSSFDSLQNSTEEWSERKAFLGKGFHPDLQELRRRLGGDRKENKQQPNSSSASSIPQPLRAPGIPQKADDQLLCFLTKTTAGSAQGTEDAPRTQEGEPAAVDPAALSAREFVIYQYGISILQFLRPHINAPEITLAVASSLPPSDATGNAFRGSFFYQNSKSKLFVLRDCLSSVGGFLLLLVHCLAHVCAAELSHDTNPLFLRLFYQALKACLSEMFSLRLRLSAAPQGDKSQGVSQVLLKEEPFSQEEINLVSQLFEVKVRRPTDMEAFEKNNPLLHVKSEEPLQDKWLVQKKELFLHGRDSLGGRARFEEETCTSSSLSELEDKVDVLTEELVQIIEDEHQFLSSKGNEDLLCYYLEITSLEKDCLVKQINALEEEIALGRKL